MSNIRIDLNTTIYDGAELSFKSPCDSFAVTGLKIYYPNAEGVQSSQVFKFADALGRDVSGMGGLFAENVLVKVILDTTTNRAFVQNANTNAYLEGKFATLEKVETGTVNIYNSIGMVGFLNYTKTNNFVFLNGTYTFDCKNYQGTGIETFELNDVSIDFPQEEIVVSVPVLLIGEGFDETMGHSYISSSISLGQNGKMKLFLPEVPDIDKCKFYITMSYPFFGLG